MIKELNKKHAFIFFGLIFLTLACSKTPLITKEEKEWLHEHPDLIVGVSPNSPPFQFVNDEGEVSGIFIDFLSLIEAEIDYKFKKTYEFNFSKLLNDSRTGFIDVLLEMQKTKEREGYLRFSPVLFTHPHVIVVRNSQQKLSDIEGLKGKTISVVANYAAHEYLAKNYPNLKLYPEVDHINCLRSLSMGRTDAFICQQAVATYYIEKEGISNLSISGEINYKNDLSIACRKELVVLHSILTKAVNQISQEEKKHIYNKWLSYTIEPFYAQLKFWYVVVFVILSVLSVVLVFFLTLQQRVKERTRELKIAKEKAEESDRLKSAFLANMSHEIRTPMNGIMGFAELLEEPLLDSDKQQFYIDLIKKSGNRMLNLINDIVNISKIEAGATQVQLSPSDMNALLENLLLFFSIQAKEKSLKIHITQKLAPEDALVLADLKKLESVLSNLIKNAIKFTRQGTIEFGCIRRQTMLYFFVKDTGPGISNDQKEIIFQRFRQGSDHLSVYSEGAGLGLAISKAFVEMLGGNIGVENNQNGNGSLFFFTIPFLSPLSDN